MMSRTSVSAARIGTLLAENRQLEESIAHLRQQPISNDEQRSAREIEIAQRELRIQRNQLEILECQITLQEARISRYDATVADDGAVSEATRVLQRGLSTLHTNRDSAERRLRKAESDLDKRIVGARASRTDRAAGADQQ